MDMILKISNLIKSFIKDFYMVCTMERMEKL